MNAIKTMARKFDVRLRHPKEYVRQRLADNAVALNRAGQMAARVELVNEALCRLAELLYLVDAGALVNVDPVTFRLLIPAPWGDHGWRYFGLRYREGRTLRRILWERQAGWKIGQRPPLYTYDSDTRAWYLNMGDYATLEAAGWWLERSAITLAEWRRAIENTTQSTANGANKSATNGAAPGTA